MDLLCRALPVRDSVVRVNVPRCSVLGHEVLQNEIGVRKVCTQRMIDQVECITLH